MKRVLVFLANGFEECEALIVVDILRRAGVEVTTASIQSNERVESSHKVCLFADTIADKAEIETYDAVVLPGGIPGTPNLASCTTVTDTCVQFAKEGKLVAAICAAPSVLGHLGLLQGKKATIYRGMESELLGAEHVSDEVAVAGNIITSRSMGTAIPFALTIAAQLLDAETAKKLAAEIGYDYY